MTDPAHPAEDLLYAQLRGDRPDPRSDDLPFSLTLGTVTSRCRTDRGVLLPDPEYPTSHWHCSERLAGLYRAAYITVHEALSASASNRVMMHAATVARLRTILQDAGEQAIREDGEIYVPDDTPGQASLVEDFLRLQRACLGDLADLGHRDALVQVAGIAEGCVGSGLPHFSVMAHGIRVFLCGSGFHPVHRPGALARARALGLAAHRDAARLVAVQDEPEETDAEVVAGDRAGIVRLPREAPPPPEPAGITVFPASIAEAAGKGENQREVKRFLGDALGARLPLVPVPEDWNAWERLLLAEFPWMLPVIRAVRALQGGRSHWGGGGICLVGAPGAGKSRFVRRIAETSDLPFVRLNMDASSDNSTLGGTPIRWLSAHPGAVERLLAQYLKANGLVMLDELEKASGSRRNGGGDPLDLLHGLLDPETSRAWRSPYLLGEIDVSNVFFVATANTLAGVPSSLQDRMRIVHVDEPGAEHLGVLAPQVAREACRELGLDERWGALDGDEYAALAEAWQGGSVRRLQRLVTGLLRARDGAPSPRH